MALTVLSVASECAPLVKTGGLADVVGALPAALAPEGVEMRTLLPGYPKVMAALEGAELVAELGLLGGPARLLAARAAGLDLIVIDAPHLYDREGALYLGPDGADWPDNPERYAALSWVAAMIAEEGAGVIVILNRPMSGWMTRAVEARETGDTSAMDELRDYGVGAQILTELGVQDMVLLTNSHHTLIALDGYGLSIVGERPSPAA